MKYFTKHIFIRFISVIVIGIFSFTTVIPTQYAHAQPVPTIASGTVPGGLNLPIPGTMVVQSPAFVPVLLRGVTIHPEDPFKFDFIVDSGNTDFSSDQIKTEATKLVKYFLAAMTIPKDDLWVNLSPYEKDRIIPEELGRTGLGRDMLAQDYLLKQLTASLMYPEEEIGKGFWERVYKKAQQQFGTTEIPVNTFNKVWIMPESVTIYENDKTVYIVNSKLKVMLDSDYEAMFNRKNMAESSAPAWDEAMTNGNKRIADGSTMELGETVVREIILPEIEKEVNEGKNFAPLRQIFHSLILSKWYKETIKTSLLSKIYIDQKKTAGVELDDKSIKEQIYEQYMVAYKKGVFDFIKEDYDQLSQEMIPRKYFSGGEKFDQIPFTKVARVNNFDKAMFGDASVAGVELRRVSSDVGSDHAMLTEVSVLDGEEERRTLDRIDAGEKDRKKAVKEYLLELDEEYLRSYVTTWFRRTIPRKWYRKLHLTTPDPGVTVEAIKAVEQEIGNETLIHILRKETPVFLPLVWRLYEKVKVYRKLGDEIGKERLESILRQMPHDLSIAISTIKSPGDVSNILQSSKEINEFFESQDVKVNFFVREVATVGAVKGAVARLKIKPSNVRIRYVSQTVYANLIEDSFPRKDGYEIEEIPNDSDYEDLKEDSFHFSDDPDIKRRIIPYSPYKYFGIRKIPKDRKKTVRDAMGLEPNRKVVVLSSLAWEDIDLILDWYEKKRGPKPLLILGMREKSDQIERNIAQRFEKVMIRNKEDRGDEDRFNGKAVGEKIGNANIVIVNTQGELLDLISIANVNVTLGYRNFVEAIAQGVRVLVVPVVYKRNDTAKEVLDFMEGKGLVNMVGDSLEDDLDTMLLDDEDISEKSAQALQDLFDNFYIEKDFLTKILMITDIINKDDGDQAMMTEVLEEYHFKEVSVVESADLSLEITKMVKEKNPLLNEAPFSILLTFAFENTLIQGELSGNEEIDVYVRVEGDEAVVQIVNNLDAPLPEVINGKTFDPDSDIINVPDEDRNIFVYEDGSRTVGQGVPNILLKLKKLFDGDIPAGRKPTVSWNTIEGNKASFEVRIPVVGPRGSDEVMMTNPRESVLVTVQDEDQQYISLGQVTLRSNGEVRYIYAKEVVDQSNYGMRLIFSRDELDIEDSGVMEEAYQHRDKNCNVFMNNSELGWNLSGFYPVGYFEQDVHRLHSGSGIAQLASDYLAQAAQYGDFDLFTSGTKIQGVVRTHLKSHQEGRGWPRAMQVGDDASWVSLDDPSLGEKFFAPDGVGRVGVIRGREDDLRMLDIDTVALGNNRYRVVRVGFFLEERGIYKGDEITITFPDGIILKDDQAVGRVATLQQKVYFHGKTADELNAPSDQARHPMDDEVSTPERSSGDGAMLTDKIIAAHDPRSADSSLVGSKAANLHELMQIQGIDVPQRFSVTTKLFDEYTRSIGVSELIAQLDVLALQWRDLSAESEKRKDIEEKMRAVSEAIQKKILGGTFNDEQRDKVNKFYQLLSEDGRGRPVAVRSSATAEDMPGASFAGKYDTFLNQNGIDNIMEAIKKVWASTYNFTAVQYCNTNGILHSKVKMGVIIQEMAEPQSAGTAFSVDTETGFPMISINNTYGLGEAEVSGVATSDAWVIEPQTNTVLKRRMGKKKLKIVNDPDNGTMSVETTAEERGRFAIDSETARQIAAKLKVIHDHFLRIRDDVKHIDVEYVVTEAGDIVFTQVRPETVWGVGKLLLVAVDPEKVAGFERILDGGITGSPGVISGKVKIVRTPEEAASKIESGDIMVAPNTTSIWERSMELAGGMVTEIGGPGSHTSVIAREQGKPALVGNEQAINVLRKYEGQHVTIDATLKRIYLGSVPEYNYFRPDYIPAAYRSVDSITEEDHWRGATGAGQTIEDSDGSRWIGKPNEVTSVFLKDVHQRSHHWVAENTGLSSVRDRYEDGVYQTRFTDIHQWREALRTKSLEELENIYRLWVDTLDQYLEASRNLELTRVSVERWVDLFVQINGIMNVAFPFSEVVSGLREEIFARKGLQEPYFTHAHSSLSGLFDRTLANEVRRERYLIAEKLKEEPSAVELLRRVAGGDLNAVQNLSTEHLALFNQFESYAKNYRITSEFALSLTAQLPIQKAAQDIMSAFKNDELFVESEQFPEEYYPDDSRLSRISRLSVLTEKVKQDSHHIKFRGQWRFMEALKPLEDLLVSEGVVANNDEIFERGIDWFLEQVSRLEASLDSDRQPEDASSGVKSYQTYTLDRVGPSENLRTTIGSLEETREILRERGLVDSERNLSKGFEQAWDIVAERYPEQKEKLENVRIKIMDGESYVAEPSRNFIALNYADLENSHHVAQRILRNFDLIAVSPEDTQQEDVESVFLDIEEVYAFLSLSMEDKARYLEFLTKNRKRFTAREGFYNLCIQSIETPQEFDRVRNMLFQRGRLSEEELETLSDIYQQRNTALSLSDLILSVSGDDRMKTGRMAQLSETFSDNLNYLKALWINKNPKRGIHEFYSSLFEESRKSGVCLLLSVVGSINVNRANEVEDQILLKRRWQITFDDTPVDYAFVGGGGFNSGTIGRSAQWIDEHEKAVAERSRGHRSVNLTSTWDRGGSSQKDADAVRGRFKRHVMSPGDIMTVYSFQSITDTNWLTREDQDSLWRSSFKPEDRDAVMDLLYTYRNRLTVPEGKTFEEVIEERIQEVYNNDNLAKPDNWHEFVVNFRSSARVIDQQLINKGFLQGIRDDRTSVQNLLLLALIMAFDMDPARASHEIHYVLGLRNIRSLPASFEDAVSGMRLEAPDGTTADEIVGHLNYATEKGSYLRGEGSEAYRGKPFMIALKEGEDQESHDISPLQLPAANPDGVKAIGNTQGAIISGMSSPFDSTLVNLLLKEVTDAMKAKVKEGVPSIYFPKVVTELQIEGLTLREIFEIMERSIQHVQGDASFRIEDIFTHVFMPQVPEEFWPQYLDTLKVAKKNELNEKGQKELARAENIQRVRDIFSDKKYWSNETNRKVDEGWIKISKLIPGDRFVFEGEDREFFASRGIRVVDVEQGRHDKLYRIWEERGVYNTNEVIRIIEDSVRDKEEEMSRLSTLLNSGAVDRIVSIGGEVIREFLGELSQHVDNPKDSPYADLAHFDNLWEVARKFRDEGASEFSDEKLLQERVGIPRLEVRGSNEEGHAAQVVVVGVPGVHRSKILAAFRQLGEKLDLAIEPGGVMSVEIKQSGVNKALSIDYIERHFDSIMDDMGYTPGDLIDARKTRTVVMADGDGTTYGKPTKDSNPTLSQSPTREALVQYLKAGGVYIVISGNELDLTVKRLLADNAIPPELRNRILVVANGGSSMVGVKSNGQVFDVKDYRMNAKKERAEQGRDKTIETLDAVYIGDDSNELGNDFNAFRKLGFRRSVTVSDSDLENMPQGLRFNCIGGLAEGTRSFLEQVVEKARSKKFQKLFDGDGLQTVVSAIRRPLTTLETDDLSSVNKEFLRQVNAQEAGEESSLDVGSAHISGATGNESGEFVAVDWGGSNLRVMLVKLAPGQKPKILRSINRRFTNEHKSGKKNPFDFAAQLIGELALSPEQSYGLGLSFGQPIEQRGVNSGIIHKWVKGWSIPGFINQDAGKLLQDSLSRSGASNVSVKALINDVVATHLSIPYASMGLVHGTGYAYTTLGEYGHINLTESGGFRYDGLPQTVYDHNMYKNMDPVNERASEKMISGAYIGVAFRMHLRALRDRGDFMSNVEYVPLLDSPQRLYPGEFEDQDKFRLLVDTMREDAAEKLDIHVPKTLPREKQLEWIVRNSIVFRLFAHENIEEYLTESNRALLNKVKTAYNIASLSELTDEQSHELSESLDGQKLQRIILNLMYSELMPEDSPDILMTKLLSLIETSESLNGLRQVLGENRQLGLENISNQDLKVLRDLARSISMRSGRLIAAQVLAAIQKGDLELFNDHIIAVDGSVYRKHPKMARYIKEGIAELRSLVENDGGGIITFRVVEDASAVGAAVAAAIASDKAMLSSSSKELQNMPVREILTVLNLDQAKRISTREGPNQLTIQRIRVPKLQDKHKAPEGLSILPYELFDTTEFELVINNKGYLIAIYPVLPESFELESGQRRPHYLDFSEYYFEIPLPGSPHIIERWEDYVKELELDRDALRAYEKEAGVVGKLERRPRWIPHVYAQFDTSDNFPLIETFYTEKFRYMAESASFYNGTNPDVKEALLPVFPTVYHPGSNSYSDWEYIMAVNRKLDIEKHHDVLVVGPGNGLDSWFVSLQTDQKIYAVGINPFEVANTIASGRSAGFEVEAIIHDNIISEDGVPVFDRKFDRIIWNMPTYHPPIDWTKKKP